MLPRALIVLLLVLNAGVATWWILREPPAPPAPVALPPGVARLQLVSEGPRPAASRAAPAPATEPGPVDGNSAGSPAAQPVQQCFAFGPFASRQLADGAAARLRPMVQKLTLREQDAAGAARAWRVYLPPLASAEEAQATAQRIGAAGFNDLLVVREGAQANSIALGRYRSETGANKRMQALQAAGFAARVEPVGESAGTATWLDVVADEAFDPRRAQATIAAMQQRKLDCARLR